jgi:hypothetical protein
VPFDVRRPLTVATRRGDPTYKTSDGREYSVFLKIEKG